MKVSIIIIVPYKHMDMCFYSTVIFLFSEENIQTVLLKLFTKMEDKKRDIRLAEFVLRTNSET